MVVQQKPNGSLPSMLHQARSVRAIISIAYCHTTRCETTSSQSRVDLSKTFATLDWQVDRVAFVKQLRGMVRHVLAADADKRASIFARRSKAAKHDRWRMFFGSNLANRLGPSAIPRDERRIACRAVEWSRGRRPTRL